MKKVFFVALLVFALFGRLQAADQLPLLRSSLPLPELGKSGPVIRVAILRDADQITLSSSFPCSIFSGSSLVLAKNVPVAGVTASASANGIRVGQTVYPHTHLKVEPQGGTIQINQREYRGSAHLVKNPQNQLLVVNEISLEDYLKGVLPSEVSDKWSPEALKAQAVASRTYALFKFLDRPHEFVVLEASVASQVYSGKTAEKPSTTEAVEATRGEVLVFGNQIFPAYFHACCGGQTAKANDVFRIIPSPVLNGTVCPYCAGTKHYQWKADISFADVESKLRSKGYTMGQISDIIFDQHDSSGRARRVTIHHDKGTLELSAVDFRWLVGPDLIRSNKMEAKVSGKTIRFAGFGWGHGVGLCQWGTKVLSDRGKTYAEILSFYYPASAIKKAYGSRSILKWIEDVVGF